MKRVLNQAGIKERHESVVIRRTNALEVMRSQLVGKGGFPKFTDPNDRRVIYASPLVDVAANMELVRETVEACKLIFDNTGWQIRLLSKSNLLPKIAEALMQTHPGSTKARMIFGVSTGTLNDGLAKVFEEGCALPSKRLASLYSLQDQGFRTFGMICPSLPQIFGYSIFARSAYTAIRAEKCEHVWAEVLNVRGESMTRTVDALRAGGHHTAADLLEKTRHRVEWERYARSTFLAHAELYRDQLGPDGKLKLRFLQYVTKDSRPWWKERENIGAILL